MLWISSLRERLVVRAVGCCAATCLVAGSFLLLQNASLAQSMAPPVSVGAGASNLALVPMPREIHEDTVLPLEHGISISTAARSRKIGLPLKTWSVL